MGCVRLWCMALAKHVKPQDLRLCNGRYGRLTSSVWAVLLCRLGPGRDERGTADNLSAQAPIARGFKANIERVQFDFIQSALLQALQINLGSALKPCPLHLLATGKPFWDACAQRHASATAPYHWAARSRATGHKICNAPLRVGSVGETC